MNKSELKVGNIVWVKLMGNWLRRHKKGVVTCKVKSVGNRFFYLEEYPQTKFYIESGLDESQICHNALVFTSEQQYNDYEELSNTAEFVCGYFSREISSYNALPISVWRKLKSIIDANRNSTSVS